MSTLIQIITFKYNKTDCSNEKYHCAVGSFIFNLSCYTFGLFPFDNIKIGYFNQKMKNYSFIPMHQQHFE